MTFPCGCAFPLLVLVCNSLRAFVKDLGPSYGLTMVDLFLNQLTDGGHEKCAPIVKRVSLTSSIILAWLCPCAALC